MRSLHTGWTVCVSEHVAIVNNKKETLLRDGPWSTGRITPPQRGMCHRRLAVRQKQPRLEKQGIGGDRNGGTVLINVRRDAGIGGEYDRLCFDHLHMQHGRRIALHTAATATAATGATQTPARYLRSRSRW